MEIIIKSGMNEQQLRQELADISGISAFEFLGQGFALIEILPEMTDILYSLDFIEDIEFPKNVFTNSMSGMISSCIRSAQEESSFGLTGEGVIVGIVDTGIDYTHPDFRNEQGGTRILYFRDQSDTSAVQEGAFPGREYTSDELNSAIFSDNPFSVTGIPDPSGHGTAVAGIAAGGGTVDTSKKGAAPEASIIAVKVKPSGSDFSRSTELMRAVKYIIDKASFLRRPAAINISYGMNEGSHKGDSLFEEYLTAVSSVWKTSIVIPTGNEGGAGHHYSGRIKTGETKNVEFFTSAGLSSFYLSMWKNFADDFSVELILPGGKSTGIITPITPVTNIRTNGLSLTVVYGEPTRYSTSQEIFFNIKAEGDFIPNALWNLRIRADTAADGSFDIWLPTVEEVTTGTYFSSPDNYATLTIPSTSLKVIRVAGYNDTLLSAAEFSGVGWNNAALPLPDIAAPSVNITAPVPGGGYANFTGTSFAAPFVTGTAALMMQLGIIMGRSPFMYGEKLKAYLRRGAVRASGTIYPNPVSGYGRLCAADTISLIMM